MSVFGYISGALRHFTFLYDKKLIDEAVTLYSSGEISRSTTKKKLQFAGFSRVGANIYLKQIEMGNDLRTALGRIE